MYVFGVQSIKAHICQLPLQSKCDLSPASQINHVTNSERPLNRHLCPPALFERCREVFLTPHSVCMRLKEVSPTSSFHLPLTRYKYIKRPWLVIWPGFELITSCSADGLSSNSAHWAVASERFENFQYCKSVCTIMYDVSNHFFA